MKSTIAFLILSLLMTTSCSNHRWTNVVPKIHLDAPSYKSRSWIVNPKNKVPIYLKKDIAECIRGARTLERIEKNSTITSVKFDSYWAKGIAAILSIGVWVWDKLVGSLAWVFGIL